MKPRVAIGITTYKPIRDASFGRALFEAYRETSAKLIPYQTRVRTMSHAVHTAEDLASHWLTTTTVELASPGSGAITERFESGVGAEWRTRGMLSGGGKVDFASELDPRGSSQVTLQHAFSPRVDWIGLFHRLVFIFEPSHGMLHVFTDREIEAAEDGRRFAFNGPVAGEENFTSWLDSQGDRRRPDSFRLEERRRYRFLPELAWANVFGAEFNGRYDRTAFEVEDGVLDVLADGSTYLQLTSRIDDLVRSPDHVETARRRLKSAFASDVFRRT